MVGGVKYKLVERSSQAWYYNCSSDCTYKTVDNDGDNTLYCFKPGALESECYYEGGMTGGSKPPTGGPMTGGPATGGPTGAPATGSPGGKCRSVCLWSVTSTIMIIPYCDCLD